MEYTLRMKAGSCLISTRGALLRSQASLLTVTHFLDAVSDTNAILGVLISKELPNGTVLGLVTLKSSGRSSGMS